MNSAESTRWTTDSVLDMARSYQRAAILGAAADLDVFSHLAENPQTAEALATKLHCQLRGIETLLNAMAAVDLLEKKGAVFHLQPGLDRLLKAGGTQTVLSMVQHQANCMRRWAQLATVVMDGGPARELNSIRGPAGDLQSFILAMDNISGPIADQVLRSIQPLQFGQLLDIGGASGTWTLAFLRACPSGKAILFDLPDVMTIAKNRIEAAGFMSRVALVSGDFYKDALPSGTDLAWISAIIHQNSRAQNRELFLKTFQALDAGGRIAIRDIIMKQNRTEPVAGALFAVNMLVATEHGGTFTYGEIQEDLELAGFTEVQLARSDEAMSSIITATKAAWALENPQGP